MAFLDDINPRRIQLRDRPNLRPTGLYLGQGNLALEIVTLSGTGEPSPPALKDAWRERLAGRAVPLLLVAIHGDRATLCGPAGEDPPIRPGLDLGQVERMCHQALAQPDRNAALRFLNEALPSLESELPGVRNEGLFSFHELSVGARRRDDWTKATGQARGVLGREGPDLLNALGFAMRRNDALTSILQTRNRDRALAILLDQTETPEGASTRCQGLSPVSYALALADQRSLPWVVVVQGNRIRLYPTAVGIGVGRRGRTETWVELQTGLMRDGDAGLLWLLLSADALAEHGTLDALLDSSKDFAADLATRLRERVYTEVVPTLATGIARARNLQNPTVDDLRLTYEMALTILFRLLFIAYAEDRDLLPYRTVDAYRHRALKTKARELLESGPMEAAADNLWHEANVLFAAVADGNTGLGVPPYDGGLFAGDPAVSRAGAALAQITLTNSVFEPALRALLLIEGREGLGPVDFRALGVREFGTIYEGLLESELAVADQNLTTRVQRGEPVYMPARARDTIVVPNGEIYLHNRSGARKSSGSHFTPDFAVDYLLDTALEPALDEHLQRLDGLDEVEAAEAFFDFRVADIAMGSGHFLVAAIDRIERKLSQYIAKRRLPGVAAELTRLRDAAVAALGALAPAVLIEDGPLLRRLVARRCIYGVDVNPLSVQLARLSIWIHTFVPGLPLSLLDHTLVPGNALVGIATVEQLQLRFQEAGVGLFPVDADNLLGDAQAPLQRLAKLADTTPRDIANGRLAMEQARLAVGPTKALCDIVVAEKVAPRDIKFQFERWPQLRPAIQGNRALVAARKTLDGLDVFHFPIAFPEVFLRRRQGFDVVVGNPPWQEATIEEHAFWARHFPGLRGLNQREQEAEKRRLRRARSDLQTEFEAETAEMQRIRSVLTSGFYPGMGKGDPDLYKAFGWRFWDLSAKDRGRIGVVLPRSALSALGSEDLRSTVFRSSARVEVLTVQNRGGWVFGDAEHRYTMALVGVTHGRPENKTIALRGPYATRTLFESGVASPPHEFLPSDILSWTSSASLPLLPDEASIDLFVQLRRAPRLDLNDGVRWRARPDTELHATNDKKLMKFVDEQPDGSWPVFKGESFDLWECDRGPTTYYAWADAKQVQRHLQDKRLNSARRRRDSAHSEFDLMVLRDPKTLACLHPRIAFRDVSRATDQRTVRAALLPANVFLTNKAPYFLWSRGDVYDQAFLLGIFSSLPLDWYARRFVEVSLNFFIINPFPVPRPDRSDPLWQRAVGLAGRLAPRTSGSPVGQNRLVSIMVPWRPRKNAT
jgi:hypothetical protein